ncbi:MAG: hypothetical protein H3C47_10070 [Candidatus Cloacimonetes bacterium]|nr:hypothetical protein [Candidatus Cloacimonadota bacterium]
MNQTVKIKNSSETTEVKDTHETPAALSLLKINELVEQEESEEVPA